MRLGTNGWRAAWRVGTISFAAALMVSGCGISPAAAPTAATSSQPAATQASIAAAPTSAAAPKPTSPAAAAPTAVAAAAPTAAAAAAPAGQAAQGVTASSIKVGTTNPMTGPVSQSGVELIGGIKTAIESLNAAGGINGRKLDLDSLDDAYDPAKSVANVRRLTEQDQVFALLAPAGTSQLTPSIQYLKDKGIIVFAPVSPPDPNAPSWFTLGTSRVNQYRVLVDYLVKERKLTKLAIIRQQDQVGQDAFEGASGQAQIDGAQIVADVQTETQATDVSAQVLKLKDANPEVVLLGVQTKQALAVLSQASDLGWHPQFAGDAGTVGGSQIITVGGQAAEGLLISQFVCTNQCGDTPEIQKVKADAKQFAPELSPDSNFLYENYASVMIFGEIVKRMGSDVSWANFIKQAETLKEFKTGLYPPVTFTSGPGGHVGTSGAYIVQVKEQKFTKITDFLEPGKG